MAHLMGSSAQAPVLPQLMLMSVFMVMVANNSSPVVPSYSNRHLPPGTSPLALGGIEAKLKSTSASSALLTISSVQPVFSLFQLLTASFRYSFHSLVTVERQ